MTTDQALEAPEVPEQIIVDGALYELKIHPDDRIQLHVMISHHVKVSLQEVVDREGVTLRQATEEAITEWVEARNIAR